MKPALSAEEWQKGLSRPPGVILSGEGTADRHSIAAICLHGQPFGFTREDVEMLQRVVPLLQGYAKAFPTGVGYDDAHAAFYGIPRLIERIEALLAPKPQ